MRRISSMFANSWQVPCCGECRSDTLALALKWECRWWLLVSTSSNYACQECVGGKRGVRTPTRAFFSATIDFKCLLSDRQPSCQQRRQSASDQPTFVAESQGLQFLFHSHSWRRKSCACRCFTEPPGRSRIFVEAQKILGAGCFHFHDAFCNKNYWWHLSPIIVTVGRLNNLINFRISG